MAGPFTKHRGSRLSAEEFNAIASMGRAAMGLTVGKGLQGMAGESGLSVFTDDTPADMDGRFTRARNDGASHPPIYGLGEIYSAVATQPGERPLLCVRPPLYPGFSRLCVFLEESPAPGQVSWVARGGLVVVEYSPAYGAIGPGKRLDGVKGMWLAQENPLGPLRVVQDLGRQVDGRYLALAELNGERGDIKYVVDAGGTCYVASTVLLGDNLNGTLIGNDPGTVDVTWTPG